MTIPSIIVRTKQEETVSSLKKEYSALLSAVERAETQYGPVKYWGNWGSDEADRILKEYIAPNLNTANYYGSNSNWQHPLCWQGNSKYGKISQYEWMEGTHVSSPLNNVASLQLADGACIGLSTVEKEFYIDINGSLKGPNVFGKDLFAFVFDEEFNLMPYGYDWSYQDIRSTGVPNACTNAPHKGQSCCKGYVCAARIIQDGWKITYW